MWGRLVEGGISFYLLIFVLERENFKWNPKEGGCWGGGGGMGALFCDPSTIKTSELSLLAFKICLFSNHLALLLIVHFQNC